MDDFVFISYSHEDKAYVHRLAEAMGEAGIQVWIDDRIDYGARAGPGRLPRSFNDTLEGGRTIENVWDTTLLPL